MLPDLPANVKASAAASEAITELWNLKNAAGKKAKPACEHCLHLVKQRSTALRGIDVSVLDESRMDDDWWPNDLRDACVASVLCEGLAACCNSMEVTPDMQDVKPLVVFRAELNAAQSRCDSEDAVKSVGNSLKTAVQRLQNIRNSVTRAANDLTRAAQAKQRRQESEKKAADKKAQQQAEKKAKEMQDSLNKSTAAVKQVCSPFLRDDFAASCQPVHCFETYQKFEEADWAQQGAFMIRKSQSWVEVCEDKMAFKSILEIFQAQFPASPTCANFGGRCQAPLQNLDAATMRDLQDTLMSYMPPWVDEVDVESSQSEACFKGMSLYGFLPTMSYVGPEYQAVGALRFSFRGRRGVVIANFSDLWSLVPADMLEQKKSMWSNKYTIISFLIEVLGSDNVVSKAMLQKKEIFKFTIVGEGDVLYVPSGSLLMEKVLDAAPCVGVRICVPDAKSEISKKNLDTMTQQYEAKIPDHEASKLLKLWKFVRALADKSAETRNANAEVKAATK